MGGNHRVSRALMSAVAASLMTTAGAVAAAPTYRITDVLIADDQFVSVGDPLEKAAPVYKPHETDASAGAAAPQYWVSSNERGDETIPPGQARKGPPANRAGITIFEYGTNRVLASLNIENACIPVIGLDGKVIRQFGGCAPAGAEGHPRHPHGIDIDDARKLAYQVIEHSGLKWNPDRTGFRRAAKTDEESSLLVVYDLATPTRPKILAGYVLGHAAEEPAIHKASGKVYVGNHEPSPTDVPCFVSVVDRGVAAAPYKFIDLPTDHDCVQGIDVDQGLAKTNGTTHVGEKMYTFDVGTDTIDYSVNIRGAFEQFVNGLPAAQRFAIPPGWVLHLHDLTTDSTHHRAYQTIHTIAEAEVVEANEEEGAVETLNEITGRWVAEVNTDPGSADFKKVTIIDLSNGQSVPEFPTHHDAVASGLSFDRLFVHAHFVAVDPARNALIVSGEHTGNLAVVDTASRGLVQTSSISRRIPGCVLVPDPVTGEVPQIEPHVHGTNIKSPQGTAYVSDEGEDCLYESVTILAPQ